MTVNGKEVHTSDTFGVDNPATGRVFAQAPDCSPDQLDDALQAASDALPLWRDDIAARRSALLAAAARIEESTEELATLLTLEQGKPLPDARFEVGLTALSLRTTAPLDLPREVIRDDDKERIEVVHQPMGVVAAITPWNFPLALAALKIGPALLAGNTVVLKPSPFTPLSSLALGIVLRDVLPPGVLNVISGRDPLGARLAEHSVPRKVSFTGSVATGKRVAEATAPDLKRLTLELGGNDAAILLDDVDLDVHADSLFWGAFANCGQICAAMKRLYVPRSRYTEVVDALADRARSVRVADGMLPGTQLGPLATAPQFARVQELVGEALAGGATAAAGGRRLDGDGYFFAPTILRDVEDGVRIVDEEQFGPVLPVIPYDDVEEALARANGTHFGLDGSVWSADPERAAALAARLECGTSWVNTHAVPTPGVPLGGHKWSGLGVEGGLAGLLSFTETKVLHVIRSR
ncbi:aldehyde dehydrogenase family protein [Streptomyces sp. NBC_01261]|uniref:aldehyde dehydrogenase family protein n=1 Tax=unclassified Streptomyces TaxID=2593676 RepID=UPI002E36A7E1|nr:aldehyde dehydrogenase family protein [Streptomyces sp. NBC_01261]